MEECGSVDDAVPSFTPIKSDYLQFNFNFSSVTAPLATGSEGGLVRIFSIPSLRLQEALPPDTTIVEKLSSLAPVSVLDLPSPMVSPYLVPELDTLAVSSSTPQIQPRIPEQRPFEIETLDQCRMDKTPLLVFISRESGLLPVQLPLEYACCCLGLFFISDLNVSSSLVLLVTFVDLPVGRYRQHNHSYFQNSEVRTHTMAPYLGMGAGRRGRVVGKHQ